MSTLNRKAADVMMETPGVHACTDVTGFGFLGHACEMIEGSDVGLRVFASAIPVFKGIRELVEGEIIPGGLLRNRDYRKAMVDVEPGVAAWIADVLYDPQTSGGLFAALPAARAADVTARLRAAGVAAAMVGEVVAEPVGRLVVR